MTNIDPADFPPDFVTSTPGITEAEWAELTRSGTMTTSDLQQRGQGINVVADLAPKLSAALTEKRIPFICSWSEAVGAFEFSVLPEQWDAAWEVIYAV